MSPQFKDVFDVNNTEVQRVKKMQKIEVQKGDIVN